MARTDAENRAEFLGSLYRLTWKRAALDREIATCVSAARAAGITWDEIGKHLGITKQAAWKKYGQ